MILEESLDVDLHDEGEYVLPRNSVRDICQSHAWWCRFFGRIVDISSCTDTHFSNLEINMGYPSGLASLFSSCRRILDWASSPYLPSELRCFRMRQATKTSAKKHSLYVATAQCLGFSSPTSNALFKSMSTSKILLTLLSSGWLFRFGDILWERNVKQSYCPTMTFPFSSQRKCLVHIFWGR